ncbi:hypothetical protein Taro_027386, partial [Colocasia esculenta]|nr:hypothetical protein [Colocasia esculenta]
MIRLQFWEAEQPWEGFTCGISFWSFLSFGPSSIPPPLAVGLGEFTPPPPRVPASGPSSVPPPLAVECRPDSLEGARTDMDEERLLGRSVQHMGRREMATNLHNNESELAANLEANMHTSRSVSFATHQSRLEKELKRPPTFQEVFDKTHKKKGMDQYISNRAREVAKSYSQQMIEKYVGEEEQPQLDPKVWVAASGALKKGHVYGFRHSTSPSEMMGFIRDEISGLESRLAQMMQMQVSDAVKAQLSQALSQAISQALSQVSIPPQAAPSTSARAPH